jgi:hypothetical protein
MRTSRAKLLATALIAGGLMALTAAGSASAVGSPLAGEWHRLNPSDPPEHELLRCVENSGAQPGTTSDNWMCRYSKAPEPTLGFGWNNNYGFLSGRDITSSWSCPDWFPEGICGNVVTVVEGTMNFVDPDTHQPPFSVLEDLVVVRSPTGDRLFNYWVDQFVCPWFRTFDAALAANPIPPAQDCVPAP